MGDSGVGKTTIIKNAFKNMFQEIQYNNTIAKGFKQNVMPFEISEFD